MTEDKIFKVPWGSDSVCYWCKKDGECSLYTEDPRLETFKKIKREKPITVKGETFTHRLVPNRKIHFTDLIMTGSLRDCPLNEFEPDYSKLPEQFKDCKIVIR